MEPPAATSTPDLQDPRYEALELVGEGVVARVFRARDKQADRPVAIKLLRHKALQLELEAIQRLAQELEILRKLHHPCIVNVHGTGVAADESPYLVMEWIEGITLRDKLVATPKWPAPDVVDVINQICSALTVAHENDVIHRDIKPENVLLVAPDHLEVKVVDFGMAKVLSSKAPVLTLGEKICGTPQYMPPERAKGKPVSAASDVYAVGIISYELLAGRRPFDDKLPMKVMLMQVNDPPPPLEGWPRAVERVISSALAKEPHDRPTAADFAHALERALQA